MTWVLEKDVQSTINMIAAKDESFIVFNLYMRSHFHLPIYPKSNRMSMIITKSHLLAGMIYLVVRNVTEKFVNLGFSFNSHFIMVADDDCAPADLF